jgi:hypothetical protein
MEGFAVDAPDNSRAAGAPAGAQRVAICEELNIGKFCVE